MCGLTHPPLLFCLHSQRGLFADLCANVYLNFLLVSWHLDFYPPPQNAEIRKMQKYLHPSGCNLVFQPQLNLHGCPAEIKLN